MTSILQRASLLGLDVLRHRRYQLALVGAGLWFTLGAWLLTDTEANTALAYGVMGSSAAFVLRLVSVLVRRRRLRNGGALRHIKVSTWPWLQSKGQLARLKNDPHVPSAALLVGSSILGLGYRYAFGSGHEEIVFTPLGYFGEPIGAPVIISQSDIHIDPSRGARRGRLVAVGGEAAIELRFHMRWASLIESIR